MTRLIIHIGPHKTGTTYLQQTLEALSGLLLDRGIYVPSMWGAGPGIPSHVGLVRAIRSRDLTLVQAQMADILAQGHRIIIISAEDLSLLGQDQVVQLRELLGPVPAEIVYYVRRWPERMPSVWQESVKHGRAHGFPEFLVRQLTEFNDSLMRDVAIIDKFATVFGPDQIKLVSYSYLVDNNLDLATHFLASFAGLSDIPLPLSGRVNPSLPLLDTELIRALNAAHVRHGGAMSSAIRDWYLSVGKGLVPDSMRNVMRDCIGTIHLDEAAPPFASVSRELVTRYASSVVPPRHAELMHELRTIDVDYVQQDYVLESASQAILRNMYEAFRSTQ